MLLQNTLWFVQFLEMAEDKTTYIKFQKQSTEEKKKEEKKALIYNSLVLLYRKGEKNNTSYTAHFLQIPAYMS